MENQKNSVQGLAAHAGGQGNIAPVLQPDYPRPDQGRAPVPLNVGAQKSTNILLSDDAVASVREANTKRNLQSNFWFDLSNYLRWGSTLTLMGGLVLIGQAVAGAASMGAALTAVGAAVATAPVVLAFTVGLGLAAATMAASSHSRRMFVERTFDVQDFQMQRQAALTGRAVQQGVEVAQQDEPSHTTKRWSEHHGPRHGHAGQSHVERHAPHHAAAQSHAEQVAQKATGTEQAAR